MNKIAAVKLVARLVVGTGTTVVSNAIIRNNVTPSTMIEQISVGAATVVIGSMASAATKAHTDAQIDAIVDAFHGVRSTEDPTTVTA